MQTEQKAATEVQEDSTLEDRLEYTVISLCMCLDTKQILHLRTNLHGLISRFTFILADPSRLKEMNNSAEAAEILGDDVVRNTAGFLASRVEELRRARTSINKYLEHNCGVLVVDGDPTMENTIVRVHPDEYAQYVKDHPEDKQAISPKEYAELYEEGVGLIRVPEGTN